ncbi:MAG: acyltransferase [Clostridiales bacterium]|nr:acyltransferase [Clostridiales bacterium]
MDFSITFYISIAFLGLILLPKASLRSSDDAPFFDRVISKEMQGFLAMFIIFHQTVITLDHFGLSSARMMPFWNYYYYGILAVSFFFFSSGFGLVKRWMTDEKYLEGFMKRRIFTVLVPFFICNYIYLTDAIIANIQNGKSFDSLQVICSFFGLFLINNQMWFAVEIMILYVMFRLIFSRVKKPMTGICIMTGIVLIMMVIGLLSGHSDSPEMSYWFKGEWWYNTILMFPLGMFYAYKEERINKVFRKAFTSILVASAVAFVILDFIHRGLLSRSIYWTEYYGAKHPILDKLTALGTETVFEILFLILVVSLLARFRFENPILKFLGKISLETIMLNYLICLKFYFIYKRYGIYAYVPAVFFGTIVSASIVYLIKNIVLERRSGLFDGDVK